MEIFKEVADEAVRLYFDGYGVKEAIEMAKRIYDLMVSESCV